jgi:hypothetical protein
MTDSFCIPLGKFRVMQLTFESPVVIGPPPELLPRLLLPVPPLAGLLDAPLVAPARPGFLAALPVLLALGLALASNGPFAIATELVIGEIVDESDVPPVPSVVVEPADCVALEWFPVTRKATRSTPTPAIARKPKPSSLLGIAWSLLHLPPTVAFFPLDVR